ncbi:MAG: GNAT family N-acetyltransferase [Solibacillus sp.]|uniref:GNAT family N-acetyltransferase n=1 Tax=unclassified Solibacillus TaxID=2637870 RepID=UPI0030F7D708
MNIHIVKAQKSDFHTVNSIVREGHDEHAIALPHVFKQVEEVMPYNYFCELLDDSASDILLAKINEEVVGFAVMEIAESPTFESMTPRKFAYMNDFGVKEAYHRHGIGKQLFQACVDWANTNDVHHLELNVWEFNEKAILFYEKFGLKTVSRKMSIPLRGEK